ncbi:hypothetical protein NESM_000263600 [Novymonas esmeraldas]|uniref:Uncharacterized protein n=1 Tax=Novymonas esmeraldas TaxID=1808958 RepID=A0AAW0FDS9_9TRYP
MEEKQDKYEQLLAKVDWHAPQPPRGYEYGIGRGAKAFVTTAELTTSAGTTAAMTREESDFFSAMGRLEERTRRPRREGGPAGEHDAALRITGAPSASSGASAPAVVKLSLSDLATLDGVSSPSAAVAVVAGRVDAAPHQASPVDPTAAASASSPAVPLVVRSARTEEGDAAEEHVFAEERVLTAYDVLKGKTSAMQAGLHNVLAMGSAEEQTTWITHARAYSEMGMTRRAHQTLVEGCAATGRKGRRIWEERLRFLAKDNYAGRRRVLEEATLACPAEEELWTQLLDCVPPLERVPCLQRAVLASPSSERLWLRLVRHVPSAQDQRALLQKALQHTPTLPLLWARLARLEAYPTGKAMFHAAAARFPSLALIVEAAKYVEWHALAHHWTAATTAAAAALAGEASITATYAAVLAADTEVHGLVRTAQQNYLDLAEAGSRHAWLTLALSLLYRDAVDGGGDAAAAAPNVYVCTAAHMLLCVVNPNDGRCTSRSAIAATWLEDLVALLPAEAAGRHSVQCALWYTWLHLQHPREPQQRGGGGGGDEDRTASAAAAVAPGDILRVLASAVLSAPAPVLHECLPTLLRSGGDAELVRQDGSAEPARGPAPPVEKDREEEEEEEELGRPPAAPAATPPSSTAAAATATTTDSAAELLLPPPLVVVVALHLGTAARLATAAHDPQATGSQPLPPPSAGAAAYALVEVPLVVVDALYRRGVPAVALAVIDRLLRHPATAAAAASPTPGDLRLHVARAKMLAAVGDTAAADECLMHAGAAVAASTAVATAELQQREEEVWAKLAVLRRSLGQAVDALLADALRRCPRSPRLWLMLLEEKRRAIEARQRALAPTSAAVSIVDLLRQDDTLAGEVRELRALCKQSLGADHCRTTASVWVFVAARVEAELLQNVPAARALLTDALAACAVHLQSARSHTLARGVSPQELERQASAVARISVTQARLDLRYGAQGQALETVHEVLQRLPKTREGTFAIAQDDALGELLSLFISLEPPPSRGRAAAQVMRQWKSREPLALCAVAQLYFAAGQYPRALDQAMKAVQLSRGRCGDAVGLLWKMAEAPVMHTAVREAMASTTTAGDTSGGGDGPEDGATGGGIAPDAVREWVLSIMRSSSAPAAEGDGASTGAATGSLVAVPTGGPLWIAVAKAEDPRNVTLLGYRRAVPDMLRDVADRVLLTGPESAGIGSRQ